MLNSAEVIDRDGDRRSAAKEISVYILATRFLSLERVSADVVDLKDQWRSGSGTRILTFGV
jgi:hypothetical protein